MNKINRTSMAKTTPMIEALTAARLRTLAMLFVVTVLFAASLPAFHQQVFGTRLSDIPDNFLIGPSAQTWGYSIVSLLAYGLLWIGAKEEAIGWIAIILLSTCVALKGALTFRVLSEETKRLAQPACIAVVLAFAMPIINWWNYQSVYLGQIAPTVWHNATTIVVMPVVILLFRASLRCLEEPHRKNVVLTAGLGMLSALIKPSYAIAWLPVFIPWFCLRAYLSNGMSLQQLAKKVAILVGPMMIVFLVQGLLIKSSGNGRVIVSPFGVWSLYSPHPAFSSLLSLAFPTAVLILYRHCLRRDAGVLLALLVFAVALLQFILLAEDGSRFRHGNFAWGSFMALYTLFLSSADVLLRQPTSSRSLSAFAILALHFASGLYFYWRIVSGLGYT
jgi:hypothetical protein